MVPKQSCGQNAHLELRGGKGEHICFMWKTLHLGKPHISNNKHLTNRLFDSVQNLAFLEYDQIFSQNSDLF